MERGSGNLLRAEDAQNLKPVAFNFEDVKALAAAHLKRAAAAAEKMLADARAQVKALEDKAAADGDKRGYEVGLKRGVEDGKKAGDKAGREEMANVSATLVSTLGTIIEELSAERLELRNSAELDLLKLSLSIASRVVKREVALDNEVAERNVLEAVNLTVSRRDIMLRVNPDDFGSIEAYLPELKSKFSELERVKVEADPAVDRGGARAVTAEGEVDLRIAEQFKALERSLLGLVDDSGSTT